MPNVPRSSGRVVKLMPARDDLRSSSGPRRVAGATRWQATRWPAATSLEQRLVLGRRAAPTRGSSGQRVRKRQPDGGASGLGDVALEHDARPRRAAPPGRGRPRPRAAPACTGAAAPRRARRVGASSTILPRYITATRSQRNSTVARSCVMKRHEKPRSRWRSREQVQDRRLHRDVERRDRLVGDQHARLDDRARARARPAGAARPRARAGSGSAARCAARPCSNMRVDPRVERRAAARSGAAAAARRRCRRSVIRGLSDEYGSWKTMCSSRRSGRICAPREVRDVGAVEPDRPGGRLDAAAAMQFADRRLAAAGLADEAEQLARAERRTRRRRPRARSRRRRASRAPTGSA